MHAGPDFCPGFLALLVSSLSIFRHSSLHQPILSLMYAPPQSPTLLFWPCHCLSPHNTLSFVAAKCHFWNNRRTCCFCGISGKFFFDPFGIKSTHKECIQGPSPASLTGVVHIWWWWYNKHSIFRQKCPFSYHLCPSSLDVFVFQINPVFEAQQCLIYFQAGGTSRPSPFSGFEWGFQKKLWGNMAKSGLFLWAIRWRERLGHFVPPLTHRGSAELEKSLRWRASGPLLPKREQWPSSGH